MWLSYAKWWFFALRNVSLPLSVPWELLSVENLDWKNSPQLRIFRFSERERFYGSFDGFFLGWKCPTLRFNDRGPRTDRYKWSHGVPIKWPKKIHRFSHGVISIHPPNFSGVWNYHPTWNNSFFFGAHLEGELMDGVTPRCESPGDSVVVAKLDPPYSWKGHVVNNSPSHFKGHVNT